MSERARLALPAMDWAIDFVDCPAIASNCARVLSRWNAAIDASAGPPRAVVRREAGDWTWRTRGAPPPRYWHELPPLTPMHVVCEVHDVCIDWYLAHHRDHLCLHGAAAKIGRGLVCFPSRGKAGKSTLIAHLMAHGVRVFCDDVLAIDPSSGHGKSLGLLPRLRAPLPRRIRPAIRDYIARHTVYADRQWIYLDPGRRGLARLNEAAPFSAFVFLDRRSRGRPRLDPVPAAEMLSELIAQNIARKIPPSRIFETLNGLVTTRPRYRLTYADPLEAARFLIAEFGASKP
jgi:hypothetical protein